MDIGRESLTAKITAAYRARATARDRPLCVDPWAAAIVGAEGPALAAKGDQHAPDMGLGVELRTAWLDAHVSNWDGDFVVLLGAGLDTRAARLAKKGVRFVEVDHPSTQAYKRALLAKLDGYPLDAVTMAPCDFERDDFVLTLTKAGVVAGARTLVVWEGVIPYLTEAAVRATFRKLATHLGEGSRIAFDYLGPASSSAEEFVKKVGEPFLFLTRDITPLVRGEGFVNAAVVPMPVEARRALGANARESELFDRWFLASAER